MSELLSWPAQICLAYLLDMLLGDPVRALHPVHWIGRLTGRSEHVFRRIIRDERMAGAAMVLWVLGCVLIVSYGLIQAANAFSPWLGMALRVYLLYACLATRCLDVEVRRVLKPLQEGRLSDARYWLSRIVGRDTRDLNHQEILRATVETTAESTCDGVVAPLFWAWVGGPLGALAFKAISTMDSMVGYKTSWYLRFGTVAARVDDIANFLPARLTALLVAMAGWMHGTKPQRTLQAVRRDAPGQPSPNSGYPEAALAGVLGVGLGGASRYGGVLVEKPRLGTAHQELTLKTAERGLSVMHATGLLALILCALASHVGVTTAGAIASSTIFLN